jgi:hypothetical protein
MRFFIIAVLLLILQEVEGHQNNESLLPGDANEKRQIKDESTSVAHKITNEDVSVAAAKAKHEVDVMFNQTEPKLFEDFKRTPFLYSTLAWNELMAENEYAKKISYSGLISVLTSQKLANLSQSLNTNWSDISISGSMLETVCPLNVIDECLPGKYRTYSGHCNNVGQPFWGASHEPMQRIRKAAYSDGLFTLFYLNLKFRSK